ncbi:MAG: hypothetical protein R3E32_22365 [Chitinophagales bacterium]
MDIQQTTTLICKDFELDLPFGEQNYSYEELRNWLAEVIALWIDKNMEHLLWVLYRLDISEEKAVEAFSSMTSPSLALADLVIARELQKISTRQKYKEWQVNQADRDEINDVESW